MAAELSRPGDLSVTVTVAVTPGVTVTTVGTPPDSYGPPIFVAFPAERTDDDRVKETDDA